MFDRTKAANIINKYGDDAYRFALILTLSQSEAEFAVSAAFTALAKKEDIEADGFDRRKIFYAVYKHAKKADPDGSTREEIEKAYGEKPEEFYDIISLPAKKRAAEHLVLYERYTKEEADKILRGKFDD